MMSTSEPALPKPANPLRRRPLAHQLAGRAFYVRCAIGALAVAPASAAYAAVFARWLAPASGAWSEGVRWSTGVVPNNAPNPGVTYDVVIDATGSPYTVLLTGARVDSVLVDSSDATLFLKPEVFGAPSSELFAVGSGVRITRGVFCLEGEVSLSTGGSIVNDGTIMTREIARVVGGSLFTNNGTLVREGITHSTSMSTFMDNRGFIDVASGLLTVGHGTSSGEARIGEDGTLSATSVDFQSESTVINHGALVLNGGSSAGSIESDGLISIDADGFTFRSPHTLGGLVELMCSSPTLLADAEVIFTGECRLYASYLGGSIGFRVAPGGLLRDLEDFHSRLDTTLVVEGRAEFGAGLLTLDPGSTLRVAPGGEALLTRGASFAAAAFESGGSLVVEGSLRKVDAHMSSVGSPNSSGAIAEFHNHGWVEVADGELRVQGAGQHSGAFLVEESASLLIQGQHDLGPGSVLTNYGEVFFHSARLFGTVANHGVTRLGPSASIQSPVVIGGEVILEGVSGPADLTLTGNALWAFGPFAAGGRVVVAPSAVLTMDAPTNEFDLERELLVQGLAVWERGRLDVANATLRVAPGGEFAHRAPFVIRGSSASPSRIVNEGTYIESASGGAEMSRAPFDNFGEFRIENALLTFSSSPLTNVGSIRIGAGASVRLFVSPLTLGSASELVCTLANSGTPILKLEFSAATLAGALRLIAGPAFTGAWGSTVVVVSSNQTLSGDFASVELPPLMDPLLRWLPLPSSNERRFKIRNIADVTGDDAVGFPDLNVVLGQFGVLGAGLPGDVNQDGVVDFVDLNIVLAAYGTAAGSSLP